MKLKPTLLVLAVTSLMAGCDNNNTSKHAPNNNADNPPVALLHLDDKEWLAAEHIG